MSREWQGPLPTRAQLAHVRAAVEANGIPATKIDAHRAAREILAFFPQTQSWSPDDYEATLAVYMKAIRGAYVSTLDFLTDPQKAPWKRFAPTGPEVAEAVKNGNARVQAIKWKADRAEEALNEEETQARRKSVSAEERRRRAQALEEASQGIAKRNAKATDNARRREPNPKQEKQRDEAIQQARKAAMENLNRQSGEDPN